MSERKLEKFVLSQVSAQGIPLFASRSALAQAITDADTRYFDKETTRSLITQVFGGRRKCPRDLAQAMRDLLEAGGCTSLERFDQLVEMNNEDFVRAAAQRGTSPSSTGGPDDSPLLQRLALADFIIVCSGEPFEVMDEKSSDDERWADSIASAVLAGTKKQIIYCVPNERMARQVLRAIFDSACSQDGESDRLALAQALQAALDSQRLKFIANGERVDHPMYVFDLQTRDEKRVAGFVCYRNYSPEAVYRIPTTYLMDYWRREVFVPRIQRATALPLTFDWMVGADFGKGRSRLESTDSFADLAVDDTHQAVGEFAPAYNW